MWPWLSKEFSEVVACRLSVTVENMVSPLLAEILTPALVGRNVSLNAWKRKTSQCGQIACSRFLYGKDAAGSGIKPGISIALEME
jgi:hypothetical protein